MSSLTQEEGSSQKELPLNIPFLLYTNCEICKGAAKSIVYDVQRSTYYQIPNDLYDILEQQNGTTISSLLAQHSKTDQELIKEYFQYLYCNDLIFFTHTPERFPSKGLLETPASQTSNLIIELSEVTKQILLNNNKLKQLFRDVIVRAVEIHVYCKVNLAEIRALLLNLKEISVASANLFLNYDQNFYNHGVLFEMLNDHPIVESIVYFSANQDKCLIESHFGRGSIYLTRSSLSRDECGKIGNNWFTINSAFVAESKSCNSCLNGKLAIDRDGYIRNCPSLKEVYGNIRFIENLAFVLSSERFQFLWNISKDDINECRICEFRYICPDCRAHVVNPEDLKSKPVHCSYNPYTGDWQS